jgi:hypothetical protein
MRYREGMSPQTGSALDQGVFLGAATFALLVGIGFVVAGLRGRQRWLAAWGVSLMVASAGYLLAAGLGYA